MKRLLSGIFCLAVLFLVAMPTQADPTPWERPAAKGERIGLVVAAGGEAAETVDQLLPASGEDGEATVVRSQIARQQVDEQLVSRIEKLRDEGSQKYFFEGPEPARDYLRREVGTKLETTRGWMGDERASSALFEASIYLVRAYLDLGEEKEAFQWMKSLVAALPAHRPDGEAFPPAIVELWQKAADDIATDRALLALPGQSKCRVHVNGAQWDERRLVVAADRLYLIGYQCGDDAERWSRWIAASEAEERPVAMYHAELDADVLEAMLKEMAVRHRLDVAVYVGAGPCGENRVCMGVYRQKLEIESFDRGQAAEVFEDLSGPGGSS